MRDKLGDKQRLQHILEAILEIEEFVSEVTEIDFSKNRMMQQACVRNFGIIGEAANHLTADIKDKYSSVNWSAVKGFRNIIVHEYFKVNVTVVWQLIHVDLVEIKQIVEQALNDFEETKNSKY